MRRIWPVAFGFSFPNLRPNKEQECLPTRPHTPTPTKCGIQQEEEIPTEYLHVKPDTLLGGIGMWLVGFFCRDRPKQLGLRVYIGGPHGGKGKVGSRGNDGSSAVGDWG